MRAGRCFWHVEHIWWAQDTCFRNQTTSQSPICPDYAAYVGIRQHWQVSAASVFATAAPVSVATSAGGAPVLPTASRAIRLPRELPLRNTP